MVAIGDYSTSEVDTGYKWIDGKPIYKKTVSFGSLPNSTSKSVAHGISGISNVIEFKGWTHNPSLGFWYSFNSASNSAASGNALFGARVEASDITIATNFDGSGYTTCYVTVWYTKT